MAYARRKDMFVRIGGEKGQKPDEFLTRSQLVAGQNIWFDYLDNWDIRINATTGGGGVTGIRMITLEAQVVQKDPDAVKHYATEDATVYSVLTAENKKTYGTAVFLDIVHNWNLSHKDKFIAEMIDKRPYVGTANPGIHSLPKIIGVDSNTVRIWATFDPGIAVSGGLFEHNRINPRFWVGLENSTKNAERIAKASGWGESIKNAAMGNTMFMDTRQYPTVQNIADQKTLVAIPPYYRVSLMEVVE